MSDVNKIAILGAESSGKSVLAEALAKQYQTVWVPEYLREFVEVNQRVPREEDQLMIARTQIAHEQQLLPQARQWLFCDTSPLMTVIYSKHYFPGIDPELIMLAEQHDYDFTIVTAPDFPWTPDGLQRESPAVRQRVHEQLLEILEQREIPHLVVEGNLEQRLSQVEFALSFLSM